MKAQYYLVDAQEPVRFVLTYQGHMVTLSASEMHGVSWSFPEM